MSRDLVKSILKKGDTISAYGGSREVGLASGTARLTGTVKSIGRVNAKIESRVRFRPDGPWFDQEHTVPLHAINVIARGEEILLDLRKKP